MEQRWATVTGPSFSPAWREVQEEDLEDRGHDQGYSASLSQVHHLREVSKSEFKKIESGDNNLSKDEGVYYCSVKPKKNTNKVQTKVDTFPVKGARKWETKYVIRQRYGDEQVGGSYPSQALAITEARRLSQKDQKIYRVHIEKHVTNQPTTRVAEISYKKSSTESNGKWHVYAECRA